MSFALRPKAIDFENTWSTLEPSVLTIINLKPISRIDWNHKFSDIYDICVALPEPLGERLYTSVRKCIEHHVAQQYNMIKEISPDNLLQEYYRLWKIYYEGTQYVHNLFGYLNKQYVRQKKSADTDSLHSFAPFIPANDIKEIGSLALWIWRKELIEPIRDQLVRLLLAAIADDREGKRVEHRETVQGVIHSFVQVEDIAWMETKERNLATMNRPSPTAAFYETAFEERFMQATKEYYEQLAQKLLAQHSCSEYMEKVIDALEAEEARSKAYVHSSSVSKAIQLCQQVMISAHKEKLNAVCHDLVTAEKKKDLRNMYRLLKPIPAGLKVMMEEFEAYVRSTGLAAVSSLSGDNIPQQFVENVLKVYDKFSCMKSEVFLDDGDFAGALDKALQAVVNTKDDPKQAAKASDRLAKYTDTLLRKSAKGLGDAEVENKLSQAIVIFRYIEDKDIFQKCYSRNLGIRLINGTSVSKDAEELMINKLKEACGYEFTTKLTRMFTDIGLSEGLSTKFNQYLSEKNLSPSLSGVTMQPLVLQAGAWPLTIPGQQAAGGRSAQKEAEQAAFILPFLLQPAVEHFNNYYISAHNGRKLNWLFNHSHGEVRLNYLDKAYLPHMSIHQMAILLCFENDDSMSVKELGESTGLSGDVLLKTTRTLVDCGVLCVEGGAAPAWSVDATCTLNMHMTSKRLRFKVPAPQFNRQVEKETEHVNNTIQQDRKYYMECAIVRIMKMRKVLKHNALITEVVEQTRGRFTPDLVFIKKSIEDLIEKSYIQRTDANDEYQYLA